MTPVPIVEAPTPLRLATITGTQEVNFVNDTGGPLADLYVRLSPNLRQYGDGRMVVDTITVDGVPVAPQSPPLYSVPDATPVATADPGRSDLILLRLPLSNALAAGGSATIRMAFTTTVPMATPDEPGVFAFTPETGTWTLAHWFPILAGYDPAWGWDLEPPAAWSDVTFANTALFDVTLTAPDDLVLVTTGVEVEGRTAGEHQVRRFTSGPVRDFALMAGADLESVSTEVNGTTVTSYYTPEHAAGGAQILEWATQSLAVFSDLFGPYPYTELDLVPVAGVIGAEFPQLLMIGAEFYPDPVALASRPGAIEFVVAHEVSHQWWYGLVGNNQHRHAFLDEGLAEYSAVLYFEWQYGTDVAEAHLNAGLRQKYATLLLTDQDWVVDQPTVDFPDLDTYFATVYRKGGLGFAALRQEIGDDAFFAGLHDYADTMRFTVARPQDLQQAFERAADRSLDDVWHLWFETASGRVEIIMATGEGTPAAATPVVSPITRPVPDG
ncbi:MAG: M1 family metallopeptidase [Chloroflexota bacterium]|nr:M1 family metallopeptidase [Chloroflexota bacterium]